MTTQAPPPAPTPPEPSGWISLHSLASAWHIPVAKLRRLLIRAGVPFRKKTFVLDNIARVPAGSAITRTYVPAHLHPQARSKAPRIIK